MKMYKKVRHFHYQVDGEVTVPPDCAVFPICVVVKSKTNESAINEAKKIVEEIEQKLSALDHNLASLELGGYEENYKEKLVSVVFGKKEKNYHQIEITFSLRLSLKSDIGFWQRVQLISQILDFLRKFTDKFEKNEMIDLETSNPSYYVEDKEMYRKQIVEVIYDKTLQMATIIGEKEGKTPTIKEVKFDPGIEDKVINLSQAVLSMKSSFEIAFSGENAKTEMTFSGEGEHRNVKGN